MSSFEMSTFETMAIVAAVYLLVFIAHRAAPSIPQRES